MKRTANSALFVAIAASPLAALADHRGEFGERHHRKGKKEHHNHHHDPEHILTRVLGNHVGGLERNNKIARRLARNLLQVHGSVDQPNPRLISAALATHELQHSHNRPRGKGSVTRNLNLLLGQIVAFADDEAQQLAHAVIITTLFATHGVHTLDTRHAHRLARQANLALKDRNSTIPKAQRLAAKRQAMAEYRNQVAMAATGFMTTSLPEDVKIHSVWMMTRAAG